VRILLFILLFLIWDSQPVGVGRWDLIAPDLGVPFFFIGFLLLIALTRLWGKRLASGVEEHRLGRAIDRFNLGMGIARALVPIWFVIGVFFMGWNNHLLLPVSAWPVVTPGLVLGLLPALVAWMGLWWSQFPVDRALREHNVLSQLESDLPVFVPVGFRAYFVNKLRVDLLLAAMPLLMISILRDAIAASIAGLSHTAPGRQWGLHLPMSDSVESAVQFAALVVVLLLSPEVLRHVLHTQRLPESDLRQSLSDISRGAGVRCREILLWRTQNNLGNALVMGLIPQVRYVLLSDLLLESMTDLQIQAVFAHEVGHVKHRHLMWFVIYFLTAITTLSVAGTIVKSLLRLTGEGEDVFDAGSVLVGGTVLILSYGFLSRWFERQADVYAARTLQKSVSADPSVPPYMSGAAVFASALHRVAIVNNIPINARNWTHGSIHARMRYIRRLDRDPQAAARFDRTGRWVRLAMLGLIAIGAIAAIYAQQHG
jgi:STE24 endopeptidase